VEAIAMPVAQDQPADEEICGCRNQRDRTVKAHEGHRRLSAGVVNSQAVRVDRELAGQFTGTMNCGSWGKNWESRVISTACP
jgi:hypothetical protein